MVVVVADTQPHGGGSGGGGHVKVKVTINSQFIECVVQ